MNLLVPTDFSELSRLALRAADRWCESFGGVVTPMHAYEPVTDIGGFHFFGPDSKMSGNLPEVEAAVLRALSEFVVADLCAERRGKPLFVFGSPPRAIATASLDHDLVVISSHGRSGLSHFLLGSVTDKAIQLIPSPVLLVHDAPLRAPFKRVLVPVDLSPGSAEVLPMVKELAAKSGTEVELVHVHVCLPGQVTTVGDLERKVRDFGATHGLAGANTEVSVLITCGSVQDALVQYLRQREAQLVALATVGDAQSGAQLLGHTPARIARELRTPLLLVTPAAEQRRKRALLSG